MLKVPRFHISWRAELFFFCFSLFHALVERRAILTNAEPPQTAVNYVKRIIFQIENYQGLSWVWRHALDAKPIGKWLKFNQDLKIIFGWLKLHLEVAFVLRLLCSFSSGSTTVKKARKKWKTGSKAKLFELGTNIYNHRRKRKKNLLRRVSVLNCA